jgi:Tol biopolymer transport system component
MMTLALTGRPPRPSRAYRPRLGGGAERVEERTLLSAALVSVNAAGTGSGDASSLLGEQASGVTPGAPGQTSPALSSDGSLLVFQSSASDLVPGLSDTNQATDVFVRNVKTGQTQLVSAAPDGTPGNGRSFDPVISPNGRYVAFLSTATNLTSIPAGTPGTTGGDATGLLYVRDLQTGTTSLLDDTPGAQASNGYASAGFVFSPDSTKLAFADSSTNLSSTPPSTGPPLLVPGVGTPAVTDNVYVRNLATGTTTAVSVTPGGTLSQGTETTTGNGSSLTFSPDGSMLAFTTTAADLTAAGAVATSATGAVTSLYVSNLASGTLTLVSGTPAGKIANGSAAAPLFSPDGSLLAFLSTSNDLTSAQQSAISGPSSGSSSTSTSTTSSSGNENLFVYNLKAGGTTAVSVTPGNMLSVGTVTQMAFSPDSARLAFVSTGDDLTSNSADTPLIAFQDSSGPNLPTWNASNVYVRNLATGVTAAVSITPTGQLSNGFAADPSFTPDGQSVAYLSSADDLTTNPTPPLSDTAPSSTNPLPYAPATPPANLFLTNVSSAASTLVSVTPTGTLSSGNVLAYKISPDGTRIAFDAAATDLTNNPPTVGATPATVAASSSVTDNIYVRDLGTGITSLVSSAPDGTLSVNPASSGPAPLFFSPDSQTLFFSTGAALVAGDTNSTTDVYDATAPFAAPGEIHFSTWQFDANEANGQAVITVVRNAPLDAPATVNYSVQDNTAKAGNDYQTTSGTLSFAAGQASATFSIPLNAAASFAGTRTATITLSSPSGGPLGFSTATLNLTGVLPTVPVSITATSTSGHTHAHGHKPKSTATGTAAAAAPGSTAAAATAASSTGGAGSNAPAAGSTVTTVYTATSPTTAATGTSTSSSTGSSASSVTASSTGSTPTSTPTSTPASGSTSTSTSPTSTAGPFVSKLAVRTTRHKVTGLIVSFNEPVAGASAGNVANYSIHLLTPARRTRHGTHVTSIGRAVGIAGATYDAASQSVTLRLSTPLRPSQIFQLRVSGGAGGITDSSGRALNSPAQGGVGSDFVYNVN